MRLRVTARRNPKLHQNCCKKLSLKRILFRSCRKVFLSTRVVKLLGWERKSTSPICPLLHHPEVAGDELVSAAVRTAPQGVHSVVQQDVLLKRHVVATATVALFGALLPAFR